MPHRKGLRAAKSSGLSSFFQFLKNLTAGLSAPGNADPASLMEELEGRLLLSAHAATPDFKLSHLAGANTPADTASPNGLTPAQVRQAYGMNAVSFGSVVGDGTGQTIAIVDAYNDPNIVADLHAFDLQFGLPNPPSFTVVNQNGSTTSLPRTDPAGKGNSWAIEIALDVEYARTAAPGAKILLVEANSASDSDLFKAVDTARRYSGVSVVSMSWGGSEDSTSTSYDSYFTTPSGHNGVTFVASSGDNGAYDYSSTRTLAVGSPASSPNVVAVGGTYLSVDSNGNYLSESGWGNGTRSGSLGGSGGGISRYEAQPAYQRGVVTQTSTYRAVPDVAMVADPNSGVAVYDSWDFGTSAPWVQVGGTSLASPLWAGVIAVADQGLVLAGGATMTSTQTLTKLYALPTSDFHDITTGNNGYAAGPGYDLVTGRGTPVVNLLVAGLVGSAPAPVTPTPVIGGFTVSPASVLTGATVTLSATGVQESSGTATISGVTFYRESNGVSGLQTSADTLVGSAALSGTTWSLTTSTTGFTPGSYTYYAVATDSASVTSSVASAALTVTAPSIVGNDNFASAAVLTGTLASVTGSNVGATKEAGEPNHAGNIGGKSVWYTWTATSNGKVTINTNGSNFDTLLAVYTGNSVSALTAVASNDDASRTNLTSTVTFTAVAGTTYRIAVDGYNYGRGAGAASGNIVLNLAQVLAPANDNFANAVVQSGAAFTWTGTNAGATRETGEPNHANVTGGASVWVAWVAPTSRTVTLNTAGSNFDTVLAVYTGSAVNALTAIASDDDASRTTLTSALTFNAVAGTTYYFAIDGYHGATGNIVLNLL